MARRADPLVRAAHAAVTQAVKAGRLPLGLCETGCGRAATDRHHFDYSRPLDVIGLCRGCHRRVHTGLIPEPHTGRLYPSKPRPQPKPRKPRAEPKPSYVPVERPAWTRADRADLLAVVGASLGLRAMPGRSAHVVAALEAEGVLPVWPGETAREVWARTHAAEVAVLTRIAASARVAA
jgi:hypothetical protein